MRANLEDLPFPLTPFVLIILLSIKSLPCRPSSPDNHLIVIGKVVLRHRQVERGGALPRPPGDVVVRAVAGAEPAAKVAGFANGDAAEVGAYACCLLVVEVSLVGGF